MFYGAGFDPAQSAPALLAVVVALFVWWRHRRDRRARVFLALAAAEFSFGLPLAIGAAYMSGGPAGMAALQALLLAAGLIATVLFLHFGLSFPHARPWLRRGRIRTLYTAALLISGAVFLVSVTLPVGQTIIDVTIGGIGIAVLAASVAACVGIYRSYREMTADERATYRVPVMGVLAGMLTGVVADLFVSMLFEIAPVLDSRYFLWTLNLLSTFSELLLPLFFFMAAVRYRLLERHSPDYVAKL